MITIRLSRLVTGAGGVLRRIPLTLLLVLTLFAVQAQAQSIYATISGTVTDSNGALIPGAKVNVTNAASGIVRHLSSNKEGFFSANQLVVGTYSVSVEAKGFKKWMGSDIVLNASDVRTLNIPLNVGAETMTVEVSATASQIDIVDSGAKAETISQADLEKQPLIGRNAMEILRIIPGSAQITNSGTNRPASDGSAIGINGFTVAGSAGGMAATSINGQSGSGLSINSDGQNVEDPGGLGSATPVNPNPDMISEVQIQTSNFGADNAKGPVVINTISKSGGSEFHGDVRTTARNSALNAEEADEKKQEVVSGFKKGYLMGPSHNYTPGFGVGGPLVIPGTRFGRKGNTKLFFHESFEAYLQLFDGGVTNAFVPTTDMIETGDFSPLGTTPYTSRHDGGWGDPYESIAGRYGVAGVPQDLTDTKMLDERPGCSITGGTMTSACIDKNSQMWMQASLPAPNLTSPNSSGWNYVKQIGEKQNNYHNMAKVDMNFTENTKAYITWSHQQETANMTMGLWLSPANWAIPAPSATVGNNTSDSYTANFLHIFSPSLTVEARVGYTHVYMPGKPSDPSKVLRKDMGFPLTGVFDNPNAPIATSWGSSIPAIGDIGHDYHPTFYSEKGIPATGADVTKVFKAHNMKFGFQWENIYNAQDAWGEYQGVFYYSIWSRTFTGNNYADMLMGANQSYYEQALPPTMHMEQSETSFYATDHWKLNSHITVDYGMRFEHYGMPYADNEYGSAVFKASTYSSQLTTALNPGLSWHGMDKSVPQGGTTETYMVFSPRVGAAIDVFGNSKTVVRGGWGMYRYGTYLSTYQSAASAAAGSVGWNAPNNATTWEDLDKFKNDGGGTTSSCAANATGAIDAGNNHCAPTVVYGTATAMENGTVYALDSTNHDQPYTVTYSLNIDQKLPLKLMAEVSYVGNYDAKSQNNVNLDTVAIGAMTAATVDATCSDLDVGNTDPTSDRLNDASCQQRFRKYSFYQGIDAPESSQSDQYDSLQAKLTRSSGWATFNLNYAFSKSLGNPTQSGIYKDWGRSEYWTVLKTNRAHVFNASYVFQMPKLHLQNALLNQVANGWQLSGITQIQSGAMLSAVNGYYFNIASAPNSSYMIGTPDATVAPVITCDPRKGLHKNQFVNGDCFALPSKTGTSIGNTRMPYMAGPMYWNSDLAAQKSFTFKEHQSVDFRITARDFLNHALLSFAASDTNLVLNFSNGTSGNPPLGTLINSSTFGYATTHYGQRIVELSAKYNF
jgi:hypothetical protein